MVTGALLEFIFTMDPPVLDSSEPSYSAVPVDAKTGAKKKGGVVMVAGKRGGPASERLAGQSMLALWAASGVLLLIVIGGWYFFLPLTYGKPGLTVPEVNARKWLNYDLHFAK
jgi:dolichyl-phosphate-mannose-protein mannosyltransferase